MPVFDAARAILTTTIVLSLSTCAAGQDGWLELAPEPASGRVLQIAGTVHHLEVEGGNWVITDVSGINYNPTNLPAALRADGLMVEAVALPRTDMVSTSMTGPLVELLRIRRQPGDAGVAAKGRSNNLVGTTWRLQSVSGTPAIAGVQATLVFSANNMVSGSASCNRFSGPVTLAGDTIGFGSLAATRMMCPEPAMAQERRYLEALGQAQRVRRDGESLTISVAGTSEPLRFILVDTPN
jgi:heat shock protein HslJ